MICLVVTQLVQDHYLDIIAQEAPLHLQQVVRKLVGMETYLLLKHVTMEIQILLTDVILLVK